MTPITIDLRDLTQAHVQAALAGSPGRCKYADPCIIGTLIPEDQREALDRAMGGTSTSVYQLTAAGLLILPEDQRDAAHRLQGKFDLLDNTDPQYLEDFERVAAPWIEAVRG